jgi:hypothetical protein
VSDLVYVRFWRLADIGRAAHTSAFVGKADMTIGTCPLLWSLLGGKQTSLVAAHMSACDPKRTSANRPLFSLSF